LTFFGGQTYENKEIRDGFFQIHVVCPHVKQGGQGNSCCSQGLV